jgi:hypothetical protein
MIENCFLTNNDFSEYFLKTFPGFQRVEQEGKLNFYNPSAGFSIVPYYGKLTKGINLNEFNFSSNSSSSVSLVSLYTYNGQNSFRNYLINDLLLRRFVTGLSTLAEKERVEPIMLRSDLDDLFSGRGRADAMASSMCSNRFLVPSCVSGERTIKGVILNNNTDLAAVEYIVNNHLV